MKTNSSTSRFWTKACVIVMAVYSMAHAQQPFEVVPAQVQPRDAALDAARGLMYLAVYNRGEVHKVNLASNETVATAQVGEGPVAAALSADKATLACVNRLSRNVSLVRADDMTPLATVPCGNGACDVAALPGGGFAVANSFSDTITIIDPARPDAPATLPNVSSVPNAVAASGSFLAVTTRAPSAVLLFPSGAHTPSSTIPLPDAPIAIAALGSHGFVVATQTKVLAVSGDSVKATFTPDSAPMDVAVADGRVHVLTDTGVQTLDSALNPLETRPLQTPCTTISADGDILIAIDPADKTWLKSGSIAPAPAVATTAEPTSAPAEIASIEPEEAPTQAASPEPTATSPEPTAPEPEQAASPEPVATPEPEVAEAQPVATQTEPAQTPATEVEPEQATKPGQSTDTSEQAAPDPTAEAQEAQADTGDDVESGPAAIRRPPRAVLGTRAPRFTRERPAAAPSVVSLKDSLGQAFTQGFRIGDEETGFKIPTNIEELLDVTAIDFEITDNRTRWWWSGDVAWRLENTLFEMDELTYLKETQEIIAKGDVHVTQELSTLDADELYYKVPLETDEAVAPLMLREDLDEEGRARKLLSLGTVEAKNLHLVEPNREFMADMVKYDIATQTGELTNATGHAGILYFGATDLRVLGPDKASAEDVWVTTCDHDPPHYRIRVKKAALEEGNAVVGEGARLQVGPVPTPLYWPKWAHRPGARTPISVDFDSGRSAEIGSYLNVGQRFPINENADLGIRFFPTEKEGVGFGLESDYDFMTDPSTFLFRSKGTVHTLYTTEDRGYGELYHRQELDPDTVLLLQAEQWSDRTFVKDFYYDIYRDRTEPRTFANVTHTKPTYLATATIRQSTHNFTAETERAPELTYHLLERQLADRFYVTFDTIDGYNEREPEGDHALRSINVGRLTLDLDLAEALSITPFLEVEGSWYSDTPYDDESNFRFANTIGTTLQTRFHRAYPGALGFSGFKHVIVPSITYSYRPEPTMGVEETPRFDAYDNVYGRSRIESKISNILFGRDAESQDVWQVARLTLYQGNDFWNEIRKSEDYEIELDIRPRPWWGILTAVESHDTEDDLNLDQPYAYQRFFLRMYEGIFNRRPDPELYYRYNADYGDYDRLLTYLYYDDLALEGRFSGRLGFAYTKTQDEVFNREILYGLSYKLAEKWALAFEHRYDFERGDLYQQEYELRRNLHCWDASLQVRDRASGWDFGFELSLTAFPGTKVKF